MNITVEIGILNNIEQSGWVTAAGITRPWEVHQGKIIISWDDADDDRLIDEPDELMQAISAAIMDEDHSPR
jgi:hypothetical protein